MNKFFLSVMAFLLFCSSGTCQEENNFYSKFFGGVNFLQSESRRGIQADYQSGYVFSGALGCCWSSRVSLEVEYSFLKNSLREVHFLGRDFSFDGHFQSSAYMVNLLWDLPLFNWGCDLWKACPRIGAGIGYDLQQVYAKNAGGTFNETNRHFGWQIIAGLVYHLSCCADISLEYKFHKGGFRHIYNQSLGIGLSFQFGSEFYECCFFK